jgi:hypothetical protein
MTADQAAEAAKGLTFEKVWAALMESRERMEEMRESQRVSRLEFDKGMEELRESQRETDRQIKESQKELAKSIGGLGNSLGRVMEAMFSAELYKKFCDIGFTFTKQAERVKFSENKRVIAEVDLFLENGEYVMLVEIKTDLSTDDVIRHLDKMALIRKCLDYRGDARKIVGAVAGGSVNRKVIEYAQNEGLYVVVQSGDAVEITDMPTGFKAREW